MVEKKGSTPTSMVFTNYILKNKFVEKEEFIIE